MMQDCAPLFQITNARGDREVDLTEPLLLHVEGMPVVSITRAARGGVRITPSILETEPLRDQVLDSMIGPMDVVFYILSATQGQNLEPTPHLTGGPHNEYICSIS